MKASLHKNLVVGLVLAATLTAPVAAAPAPETVKVPTELAYIQAPGGSNDLSLWENFRGGPGAVGPIPPSTYLGHELAGPGGVTNVANRYPVAAAPTPSGFDWADAAVGAGFATGLAVMAAAGLLAVRRRRPVPQV